MHISASTEYAIHSVLYMAIHQDYPVILVSDVAKAQNIPASYLAKVFRILAKNGVIRSYRGSKGGYSLSHRPERITVKDVVEAIEGTTPMFQPLGKRRGCGIEIPCIIQNVFRNAQESMLNELERVNFQDLIDYARNNAKNMAWLMKNKPNSRESS
jgi:Rrf2 family iron-sulfur cluster assembly transcriptional regulator